MKLQPILKKLLPKLLNLFSTSSNTCLAQAEKHSWIYPGIFAGILSLSLFPYYSDHTLILGGEGNFVLNFTDHFRTVTQQWVSRFGLGSPNLGPGGNFANILLLILIENLTPDPRIPNFTLIFLMYYFPFLGMYLVAREAKVKSYLAFLAGMFYLLNPYTLTFLSSLNQWNASAASALPFLFWIIQRYYLDNLKLFFFYGVTSSLFSFAYSNPPLSAIIQISSLLAVYIISYDHNQKVRFGEIARKYLLILFSFLLVNCWWTINLFYAVADALKIYSTSFAHSWLISTVGFTRSPVGKSFSLTHISPPPQWDYFGFLHHTFFGHLITLSPMILLILGIFFMTKTNRLVIHTLIITLCALFFLKGANEPLGQIYMFFFKNFPFFNIFKTPVEKFGLLYTFLFSILLLLVLKNIQNKKFLRPTLYILGGYLCFCLSPLATGNIIPNGNIFPWGVASRIYADKPEYASLRESINKDKLLFRVMSLPGMGNYQILMSSHENKMYTGMDPVLYNTFKPLIEGRQIKTKPLYSHLLSKQAENMLGLFGVGKIVVNRGQIPWFGLIGNANAKMLNQRFHNHPAQKFGKLILYDNMSGFVPLINVPSSLIIVDSGVY
ncbi:hypothetical protein UR09_00010 [Candidatus Nitromaritima sp. SCGC AAA799-A02]|nr:hypothetical protein UR09_00010 [Candidatus Nitromaritima sp. SCGC AAA799-A02]